MQLETSSRRLEICTHSLTSISTILSSATFSKGSKENQMMKKEESKLECAKPCPFNVHDWSAAITMWCGYNKGIEDLLEELPDYAYYDCPWLKKIV